MVLVLVLPYQDRSIRKDVRSMCMHTLKNEGSNPSPDGIFFFYKVKIGGVEGHTKFANRLAKGRIILY